MILFNNLLCFFGLLRSVSSFAPSGVLQLSRVALQGPHRQRVGALCAVWASSPRQVSKELLQLFNKQITNELGASQLYLSASLWCKQRDLVGMASYMRKESEEERRHALAMMGFANKRNIPVNLEDLEAPDATWASVEDLWEEILDSEVANTQSLLKISDAAADCKDHAMVAFLQPYHMEQVNSEDNLGVILAKVRDENKTPGLIRQLDEALGGEGSSHH